MTFFSNCQSFLNSNYTFGVKSQLLGNQNFTSQNNSALDLANNISLAKSDSSLKIGFSTKRIATINAFSIAFSKSIKNGNAFVAFQSIPFGKINEYTSNGISNGQFNAGVNSISTGYGYRVGLFSMGASARLTVTSIQNYQNIDVGLSFNGHYENTLKGFAIGWNIQNIHILNHQNLFKDYSIPNVSVGGSLRPKYIPVKFHFSAFDLIDKKYKKNFALGLEILENKPFNLLLGYNNASFSKFRMGLRFQKTKYSFLIGTEIGAINTQYFEINYFIKKK